MECCDAVQTEVRNVIDKFEKYLMEETFEITNLVQCINEVKTLIENAQDPDSVLTPDMKDSLEKMIGLTKKGVGKLTNQHRSIHTSVSKIGKIIDRNFDGDYGAVARDDVFAGEINQQKLSSVIIEHFYRQGRLDIGDLLAEEAGLEEKKSFKAKVQELNTILEAIRVHNLGPALEWAARNREELNLRGTSVITEGVGQASLKSSLEMKLHKLQFIELLRVGKAHEAIKYSQAHFPEFVCHHEREIQRLMGAIMYAGPRMITSPYSHLLDESQWHEIEELFIKDACSLIGLSVESPLSVTINAGCTALPSLLTIKQVMQNREVAGNWSAKDELPIEIDLGPGCRYHSIFACPILKQQTTASNPPMRLKCGHCISRDALTKLTTIHKLKCPYCPVEQSACDAKEINF